MSNYEIAKNLIKIVGGKNNIKRIENCMTRCRLELVDYNLVNIEELEKSEKVLGVVKTKEQLQIIYGPGIVNKITNELNKLTNKDKLFGSADVMKNKSIVKEKNNTKLKNILKKLGNIFIPLIPLFVACGLILSINNICNVYFGESYKITTISKIINLIGNGVFSILPVLVGVNTAKEFGSQIPMLGGVLGGILSSQSLLNINLFGKSLTPGRGGIISVILVVILSVYIENICRKFVPDILDLFITPLLSLCISVVVALLVLQPLGGFISDSIGIIISKTISSNNKIISIVSGAMCGGLFLPLVMTGMHQALIPIHADLINKVGFTVLLPILATAGMAQVGATLAVMNRTKNNKLKIIAKNGLLPGFLGIGEPLIYGVTLPLGKPFIAACFGASVGGAFMALYNVGSVALGVSGLPLILLISDGKVTMFLIGAIASYLSGYFFTKILGFEDPI